MRAFEIAIGKNLAAALAVLSLVVLSLPLQSTDVFSAEPTDQDEAAAFLKVLGDKAIAVLADENRETGDREAEVADLLRTNLELEAMGRFVLGQQWRKATPEQRTDYVGLFSEFVVRTYSRRLGGYGGQSFEITGTSQAGKRDALVITEIRTDDGSPPVKAGWRVKTTKNGALKIVDVIVEGASMLQAQREEFKSVLRKSGLDGLMARLQEMIDQLPNTAG